MSKENAPDFNELSGLRGEGFRNGEYLVSLILAPCHRNLMGTVHGGVFCTLLDTAMTRAALHGPTGIRRQGATLEMKTNFLKGAREGRLTAYGYLVQETRRTAYVEGRIEDDDGQLLARASATIMLFEPRT